MNWPNIDFSTLKKKKNGMKTAVSKLWIGWKLEMPLTHSGGTLTFNTDLKRIFNKLNGVHKKKASKLFKNAVGVIVAGMCILTLFSWA